MSTIDINDYVCADKGILLPAINEYTWPVGLRAFLYALGMFWCFLGIAIVADMFMCGIEKITSKTRMIKVSNPKHKDGYEQIEVKVWNDTVANLSLMAFGTSAPEIMLSVIDICARGFQSSDLGPATIVGSAAFNLLIITGICIASIPNGEIRKISNNRVYGVTTFFSMFAYFWILVVLLLVSPGQVDIWEAIVTFLMFPVLIIASFLVDKMYCCKRYNKTSSEVEIGIDTVEIPKINYRKPSIFIDYRSTSSMDVHGGTADIIHIAKELSKHRIPEEEAAKIAALKLAENQSHNKGWYRIQATRSMTGGHRLLPKVNEQFKELYEQIATKHREDHQSPSVSLIDLSDGGNKAVVEFTSSSSAVMENAGKVTLGIKRYGKLGVPITVRLETIDGTAEAKSDYIPVKSKVTFSPNETHHDVHIEIVDDDIWEPDEFFFAKLFLDPSDTNPGNVLVGPTSINQITIINDDEPGKFEFSKPSYVVREGTGAAQLYVNRVNGADGAVSVRWTTKDMTAESGKDFVGGESTIEFAHGETQKTFEITMLDTDLKGRDCSFMIELKVLTDGAEIGKLAKTIVTLVTDEEFNSMVARIAERTQQNLDSLQLESSTWGSQFRNALNVNGGDIENATTVDYVLHFCSFFWKVLFAFIPPPSIGGGWLTFSLSLAMIGVLTAIVGDLATIFGCLVGLSDLITAITFVALGTSMPDTFASRQAALQEKWADSSIGNINGSNAVNVFLGLGLPWLMASIYWGVQGQVFKVSTGSLAFSVVLYLSTAVTAMCVLLIRRRFAVFGQAELGGPVTSKWSTAAVLFSLWIFYILLSSLQSMQVFTSAI